MTPLKDYQIFEELRYVIEIFAAELLFFIPSPIQKKKYFWYKASVSLVILCVLSMGYVFIPTISNYMASLTTNQTFSTLLHDKTYTSWYLLLLFVSMIFIYFLFDTSWKTIISRSVIAWCIQHIEYVLINESIGIGLWNETRSEHLVVYIIISIVSCIAIYFIFYKFLKKYIKLKGIDDFHTKTETVMNIIILVVLVSFTFFCQGVFYWDKSGNYFFKAAFFDVLICLIFIISQLRAYRIKYVEIQKRNEEQIFSERLKQYEHSKNNVEIINHKIHDFKQQIYALKHMNNSNQDDILNEVNERISIFDSYYQTGNDAFDIILTEKKMLAEKENIKMTVLGNGKLLNFMQQMDIYVLFGNMLDNAIEACERLENNEEKIISMTLKENAGFIYIEQNNYFSGELKKENNKIVTIKEDKDFHGFGLKSIKDIVNYYDGIVTFDADNNIFNLRILIPIKKQNVPS